MLFIDRASEDGAAVGAKTLADAQSFRSQERYEFARAGHGLPTCRRDDMKVAYEFGTRLQARGLPALGAGPCNVVSREPKKLRVRDVQIAWLSFNCRPSSVCSTERT